MRHETHPALAGFHEPVRTWFTETFGTPTRAQELGWPLIQAGQSALILAPTGSGKTLAAFLAAIDRLMFDPVPPKAQRCRVLYVSPLKALAVDVERNLRAPLEGVWRCAQRSEVAPHLPAVAIRTGDTPGRERAQFNRSPADILITTPESLYLLLTSNAREALRSVRWVIVDEVHAMVATKRGAHLALSLERLQAFAEAPLQRIGLSATVQLAGEAARFLGGFGNEGVKDQPSPQGAPRPVAIVDAGSRKALDLMVTVPVEELARSVLVPSPSRPLIPSSSRPLAPSSPSIWEAIHPLILELIHAHRSTLIFVNSRRLAERLAAALNALAGKELVLAHHGSIAREQRLQIEEELKAGRLPAMVATSSLELGIDMGAIDLVIQVEAPPSVASGLQRIGRAGHQIGVPSKGVILPKYRGDLLACAALTEAMRRGAVEPLRYPRQPLDVLAQQIVAMVAMDDWPVADLEQVVRRAAPFAEMPRSVLEAVLDMLSGRYPSDEFASLRARLTWDRVAGRLSSREGARGTAVTNGGTIPDRGLYGVFLLGAQPGHGRVGELDEEMVFESKPGETFLLGASTWRIEEITHDRVLVSPAPGVPGKMPFWHGDTAGRPLEFGRAIGALSRTLRALPEPEAMRLLQESHALDAGAARHLLRYLEDQWEATGAVPDDRTIVIERYLDEMGDWRVCVLSPFGAKVHAPWAMAIGAKVREKTDRELDILWADDGIVARFPEAEAPPPVELLLPGSDEVQELVVRQLGFGGGAARSAGVGAPVTALFASRFREAAARALLLPRSSPGRRAPLWQQRKRAADLLAVTAKFESFPIVLETYRECLRDVFDMPALVGLLEQIERGEVRTVTADSRVPSPFAAALLFNYVANFMYEGDAPLAERRAQALSVDPARLRELLGEVELRELLDAGALALLERQLQHLTEERKARHPDGLHDLLLRLGDLCREEIMARVTVPEAAAGWIARLEQDGRILSLTIAGEPRLIAVEDAGRYRDALGVSLPDGVPEVFLEPVRDPLGDLIARYARTHGPFEAASVAARCGLGVAPVTTALSALEQEGRVVQGEFRPGGTGQEWCDAGVLRALRQKSLARLRHEVEPVEPAALGRLYLDWQGIRRPRHGHDALIETIAQLQGATVPASVLEHEVLPARLERYDPRELDALTASGSVLWVGSDSLGPHDGRVSLYLTEQAGLLLGALDEADGPPPGPRGPLHDKLREHLATRGASFFPQLLQAAGGGFYPDVLAALWELVWAGEVTNDTLQPLRALLRGSAAAPRRRPELRSWGVGATHAFGVGARRSAMPGVGSTLAPAQRAFPPEAAGRWSLVRSLVGDEAADAGSSAPHLLVARAQQLLDRYGVLTREAVQAEGIEGGFSAVYPILKAMEEAGQVRRGHFVAGRGALQFALPAAVERLRALREPDPEAPPVLLAATDPANPWGAGLPWPEREAGQKPARMAGASVILLDGALAAYLARGDRQLLTFPEQLSDRDATEVAAAIAHCLADQVAPGRRRSLFLREVDGRPTAETPLAAALIAAGFTHGPHGFMKRV